MTRTKLSCCCALLLLAMVLAVNHSGSTQVIADEVGRPRPTPITPKQRARQLIHEGLNHLLLGNAKQSEESFIQAKSINPYSEEAYNFLGLLYIQQGLFKKAEDVLLRSVAIDPMYGEALRNLGKLYLQQEEFAKAAGYLRRTLNVDRGHAYTWYLFGMALYFDGRAEDAIKAYEEAFALGAPLPNDAHYNLGVAYHEVARYFDAAREYEMVLKADPGHVNALNNLGLVHSVLNNKTRAVGLFNRVLELEPRNLKAKINLGNVYLGIKELDKASEIYRRAIEIDPEDISPRLNLGVVYFEKGDFESAKGEWRRILDNHPDNLRVLSVMGSAYLEKKQHDEAIEVFRRMLPLAPDNGSIANTLGYLLAEQNRELDYSKELIKRALELDKPNRATYLDSLALVYYRKGDYQKAREVQERALGIFRLGHKPISSVVHLHMGWIYEKLDELEKAKAAYADAINSATDSEIVAIASESLQALISRE